MENINYVEEMNGKLENLISEAKQYYFDNYYVPELQLVIDTCEEFTEMLSIIENEQETHFIKKEHVGAYSYKIGILIEALKHQRENDWSCKDLVVLETLENYTRKIWEIL